MVPLKLPVALSDALPDVPDHGHDENCAKAVPSGEQVRPEEGCACGDGGKPIHPCRSPESIAAGLASHEGAIEGCVTPSHGAGKVSHQAQLESLPESAASHLAMDLDERARLEVEGICFTAKQTASEAGLAHIDHEAVLCVRWLETMEAA